MVTCLEHWRIEFRFPPLWKFALESSRSAARFSRHFQSVVTDGKVGKTWANQIIYSKTKAIAERFRLKSEFSSSPPAVTLTRPWGDFWKIYQVSFLDRFGRVDSRRGYFMGQLYDPV